jgi:exopolysaccharide biosynthesis protein
MNLYKLSSSGSFAGDILPAMPSHASDLNPRTCIFRDKNNNVFFVNVEGRNKICGGMGLDLFDLATLCKSLGAVDAINLDGGGSSIMEIKEKNKPYSEHIGYYRYPIGNMIKISPK